MSEIYTTIIHNIKDNDDDTIDIKIIFTKIKTRTKAEAFDSKGRYFRVVNFLEKEFEYYKNKGDFNLIIFDTFEEQITICLEGGGWYDNNGLEEDKDSPYHLQEINKKITEVEEQLIILKEDRNNIKKLYELI
jgi:hypothetical protein